jgi:hypothetical protein
VGPGRLALHVLLPDQRLKADLAVRVAAEGLEGGIVDQQDDRRLVVARQVDVVDLADLHARDLHVLAGDDEARVVEDRAHPVAVAAPAACGDQRAEQQAPRQRPEQSAPQLHGVAPGV